MIKYIITILLSIAVFAIQAQTGIAVYSEEIPVKIQILSQKADSVYLDMDIDLKRVSLNTQRSLILTPILTNGHNEEVAFGNIILNGRQRHKAFMREVQLNGLKEENIVLDLKTNRRTFHYNGNIPYEPWMRDAHLSIRTDLCGCAGYERVLGEEIIADHIDVPTIYIPQTYVAYVTPAVEQVKARSESYNVFLDFPVSGTQINPLFGSNSRELSKIEQIINEIRSDSNIEVKSLMITGYASPEGKVEFNEQLSRKRAEAFKDYLSVRMNIPLQMYRVGYGGEDWKGLEELLQTAYIDQKETILDIIRNASGEIRKQQLKSVGGGKPYQQMLLGLYPKLRKVVARIDYTIRNFSIDEARNILETHPEQLSLNEMYILANTYKEDSKDFTAVFETALRFYPDDPVANLNSAATALLQHDTIRAEQYLEKAPRNIPEYFNNLGVLQLQKNNGAEARQLFERAARSNLQPAIKNLEELNRKEERP